MRKKARKLTEQATHAGLVPQQGGMGEKKRFQQPLGSLSPPPPQHSLPAVSAICLVRVNQWVYYSAN